MRNPVQTIGLALLAVCLSADMGARAAAIKILNVASDNTQDFFQEYNPAFTAYWKQKTGQTVVIQQSFGDSSAQAQSVIESVDADVVTLDKAVDVDSLYKKGRFLEANWPARLPDKSVPFTSTIVFLVHKGNPKNLSNWDDLARPGIFVVAPSPKTSDAGRYSYLAAWGYALKKSGGDEKQARGFVSELYANAPFLNTDGDEAATTFANWGAGDVLLTYENEAALIQKQHPDQFEVVLPLVSIVTENAVAWVDHEVEHHGSEAIARAYLEYLYSDAGQELAAQHFFRPGNETIRARYATRYQSSKFLTVGEIAGSWQKAQQVHFADGGIFDQIYHPDNNP